MPDRKCTQVTVINYESMFLFVLAGSQGGLQGCAQGALRVSAETCRQEEMREAEEICGQAERHGQVVIGDSGTLKLYLFVS